MFLICPSAYCASVFERFLWNLFNAEPAETLCESDQVHRLAEFETIGTVASAFHQQPVGDENGVFGE